MHSQVVLHVHPPAGARLGFYTPIKAMVCGDHKQTLGMKVLAGGLSGGLSAAVTSPMELIKVWWLRASTVLLGGVTVVLPLQPYIFK